MESEDRQIEGRIVVLERNFHELDKNNALLSGEVKNLSETINRLAIILEKSNSKIDKVSDELAVILPKIYISQHWETIYKNGTFFVIGLVISGTVGVIIHYFMK